VVAAASPATSKFAPPAAPSSGAQGNSVSAGSSPSASVPINHTTAAPTWVTLAMSAATYTVVAPTPSTSSASGVSGTTAPAPGSPATSTGSGAGTSVAPPPAGAGQPAAGSTTTAKTAPTSSTTSSASHALTLPIGTCTGVTGFPGVTAPTSVPPLASSVLDAVLSTGALSLGTVSGSPAFGGTALVKATSGSTAPVNVKVGTCLAAGGSILAVDLTGSTGDEVQLVGSLVAQPVSAATGSDTYLFRGNVTQVGGTSVLGAGLPWGLPQGFVAEVQVQTTAKTGALTVVFVQPENQTGPSAATPGTSTSATTAGGATSTATSTATSAGTTSSDATTTSATRPSGPLVVGGGSSKTT
jgi:subtilase-type serine protease